MNDAAERETSKSSPDANVSNDRGLDETEVFATVYEQAGNEQTADCILVADPSDPRGQVARMFQQAFQETGNRRGRVVGKRSRGLIHVPASVHLTSDRKVQLCYMNRRAEDESIPNSCSIDPKNCEIETLENEQGALRVVSRTDHLGSSLGKCMVVDFDAIEDPSAQAKYERLSAFHRDLEESERPWSYPVRGNATFYCAHESERGGVGAGLRKAHVKRLNLREKPSSEALLQIEAARVIMRGERKARADQKWGDDGLSAHNGTTLEAIISATVGASSA